MNRPEVTAKLDPESVTFEFCQGVFQRAGKLGLSI
jgi:hypothetical protein